MDNEGLSDSSEDTVPVPKPKLIGRLCCSQDESHVLHDHWNEYGVGEEVVITHGNTGRMWFIPPEQPLPAKTKHKA